MKRFKIAFDAYDLARAFEAAGSYYGTVNIWRQRHLLHVLRWLVVYR